VEEIRQVAGADQHPRRRQQVVQALRQRRLQAGFRVKVLPVPAGVVGQDLREQSAAGRCLQGRGKQPA
jgi:hypothetical protein